MKRDQRRGEGETENLVRECPPLRGENLCENNERQQPAPYMPLRMYHTGEIPGIYLYQRFLGFT